MALSGINSRPFNATSLALSILPSSINASARVLKLDR